MVPNNKEPIFKQKSLGNQINDFTFAAEIK